MEGFIDEEGDRLFREYEGNMGLHYNDTGTDYLELDNRPSYNPLSRALKRIKQDYPEVKSHKAFQATVHATGHIFVHPNYDESDKYFLHLKHKRAYPEAGILLNDEGKEMWPDDPRVSNGVSVGVSGIQIAPLPPYRYIYKTKILLPDDPRYDKNKMSVIWKSGSDLKPYYECEEDCVIGQGDSLRLLRSGDVVVFNLDLTTVQRVYTRSDFLHNG